MPRPETSKEEGTLVYPLFPLGSIVYLPETEHVLNIFEPRYRQMYNDILLSGSRSFAVTMVGEDGSFAEYASIFYLDELKEVSEQTKDQVKYVCRHKVTKRVRLKKVLNPSAFRDRSTYLRVEVEEVADEPDTEAGGGDSEDSTEADIVELCRDMDTVVDLQNSFNEEPRFSPKLKGIFTPESIMAGTPALTMDIQGAVSQAAIEGTAFDAAEAIEAEEAEGEAPLSETAEGGAAGGDSGPAEEDKVWALASLWQTFASERMGEAQRKGATAIENKLLNYLTKNGTIPVESLKGKELRIPADLEKSVAAMTAAVKADLAERAPTLTVPYQQLMQSTSRGERVRILRRVVLDEKRRLEAKQSLKALFGSSAGP